VKTQKRLDRLEQEYFPESKLRGFYLWELQFIVAFSAKYDGHEDSAPAILRRAFHLLQKRPQR
jgi:hypothetical protein